MPKMPDTELQARLLRDMIELSEKKRKLEEDLRIVDARNKLLIEKAARKDIEEYSETFSCRKARQLNGNLLTEGILPKDTKGSRSKS